MEKLTGQEKGTFRVTTARSSYTINLTARTVTRDGEQVLADNDMFVLAGVEQIEVDQPMKLVVLVDGDYSTITSSRVRFISPVVVVPAA